MLFAESLGCGPAVLLKSSAKVQVDRMILSGPEYPDFGVMNKLLLKIMPPKLYRTAHEKPMPAWVLRFMGQTEQGMQTMMSRIPDNISLESVRATWAAGLYLYRTPFPVQPEAAVACWYGEKEGHKKKAIQKLKAAFPKLTLRCFKGVRPWRYNQPPAAAGGGAYAVYEVIMLERQGLSPAAYLLQTHSVFLYKVV